MKVKYIKESCASLENGNVYDVLSIEYGLYRIVDETEDDYLFPPESFEIVDDSDYDSIPKIETEDEEE